MFEVGISELLMVTLVALIVIDPKQLPKTGRLAGFWIAKIRNQINQVKAEIHQQLQLEEIQATYTQSQSLADTKAALLEIDSALDAISHTSTEINEPTKS